MSKERAEYGDAAVGQDFDGYRIQGVLGRGGMGIVYRAEDEALSRTVALKMIDPSLAKDEAFLRRFRAEARALARIDSPHIVGIYALRQTEIGHFIVMEYIPGGTVSDLLEKGSIPWKKCVPIVRQILKALNDAHGVGVIHRDIKPGNVMLSDGGRVKVADFGLAKMSERDRESTVTMGISGTLYYMSPEQVKGSKDLDHRSDLYSLGMLMYEMLTGKLPVERGASQFTVMKEIVEKQFKPPESSVKNLPAELNAIVMRALEKDPANRFQSAGEMLDALNRVSADTEPAGDVPVAAPPPSGNGRSRLLIGIAAAVVLLLGLGGYLVWKLVGAAGVEQEDAIISVYTDPEDVAVSIDGIEIGQTPITAFPFSAGRTAIRLTKPGYAGLDTVVTLSSGETRAFNFWLARQVDAGEAVGNLSVRSSPTGATVLLDGQRLGTTPIDRSEVPAGMFSVEIRRDGFHSARQDRVEITEGETVSLVFDLQPLTGVATDTREPERPAVGALTVSAEPAGPVSVNGQAIQPGSSVTLEAGRQHEVACGDPPYQAVQRVAVAANERKSVTCYFRHTVNVVVQEVVDDGSVLGTWATLTINGEPVDAMINELGPGTYNIGARRQFYSGVFSDTILVIRPAFDPVTHRITFRIRQDRSRY